MTYEEQVQKNMELGEQFTAYALEHPDILKKIPEGAEIVFLPEDDSELTAQNQKIIARLTSQKQDVIIIRMRPIDRTLQTRIPLPKFMTRNAVIR